MSRHDSIQAILLGATLLLVTITGSSCQGSKTVHHGDKEQISLDIARIRAEMLPLKPGAHSYTPPAAITDYFSFYDLDPGGCLHLFGTFTVQKQTMAGHIFMPAQEAKGTIFLLHGYYDHSGIMSKLIAFCLEQGLAVAIFDLPGHGLSSGPRFAINDFSDYATVLTAFVNLCQDHLPRPFHLMAHSLGCAIAHEYLQNTKLDPFSKVIFLAPLIHSRPWLACKTFYFLSKAFTTKLPRKYRRNSSDLEFLAFTKRDPLQRRMVLPMAFLGALYRWEKRAQVYGVLHHPLLIIQGQEDGIVDWHYNLRFLEAKFSQVHKELIAGANHQLANENQAIRTKLFDLLHSHLNK